MTRRQLARNGTVLQVLINWDAVRRRPSSTVVLSDSDSLSPRVLLISSSFCRSEKSSVPKST